MVAQSVTNEVLAFDPDSGAFQSVFAAGPPGTPIYMEVAEGVLYVGAFSTDSVWRFDSENGALIDRFIPPGRGGLNGTHDLAFLPIPEPSAGLIVIAGFVLPICLRRGSMCAYPGSS